MEKTAKAILFDMDGTLIDTEKLLFRFWRQAARECGYDMSEETALSLRSLSYKYAPDLMHEKMGGDFDYFKVRERRKALMKEYLDVHGVEAKPDLKEVLFKLTKKGYKLAVVTATAEDRAKKYLTEIDVYSTFDKVICATMVEYGKPSPDVYLYACEQIGEDPNDCIAVEDSPNGILSAYRAGCKPVMIPDLTEPDEELAKLLYAKADGLKGLLEFL